MMPTGMFLRAGRARAQGFSHYAAFGGRAIVNKTDTANSLYSGQIRQNLCGGILA